MQSRVLTIACALLALQVVPFGAADQTDVDSRIKNQPPMVIQIEGVPERVVPLAGGAREVTFSFMARDPNGWQDIVRAEVGLYQTDNLTFMRHANVTGVSGGNGASHWFNATFMMWYYEMPTSTQNYTLHIRVVDQKDAWSKARYAEFEYAELAAISITTTDSESTLDANGTGNEDPALGFGSTAPGESSDTSATLITNTGNVVVDLEVYGTDLVNAEGYTIPVSSVRYDVDSSLTNESALTHGATVLSDFDLQPGSDSSKAIYWVLRVPTGDEQYVPAGTYAGSVTISAIAE